MKTISHEEILNRFIGERGTVGRTKFENGKFNLTLATINKIASALGARVNFDLRPI